MIAIDITKLSEALSDLQQRTLVNLISGRIQWPEIIHVIEISGMNNAALAKRLGKSRSTIHRLKNGSQPQSFDSACRLILIYQEIRKRY